VKRGKDLRSKPNKLYRCKASQKGVERERRRRSTPLNSNLTSNMEKPTYLLGKAGSRKLKEALR
jgi:hypothetical protein